MPITAGLIVMAALQELGKREISIRGSENKGRSMPLLSSSLCNYPLLFAKCHGSQAGRKQMSFFQVCTNSGFTVA